MLDQTLLFYHIYYIVAISVNYLIDYLIGSNFFNFKFLALFLIYLLPIRSYFIYLNIKKMSILVKVGSDKNKNKKKNANLSLKVSDQPINLIVHCAN